MHYISCKMHFFTAIYKNINVKCLFFKEKNEHSSAPVEEDEKGSSTHMYIYAHMNMCNLNLHYAPSHAHTHALLHKVWHKGPVQSSPFSLYFAFWIKGTSWN